MNRSGEKDGNKSYEGSIEGDPSTLLLRHWEKPLRLFQQAASYSSTNSDNWMFAVDIRNLKEAGLTENDFRWLMCKGHIEHAHEKTPINGKSRSFHRQNTFHFSEKNNFVLTDSGSVFVRTMLDKLSALDGQLPTGEGLNGPALEITPVWDALQRKLLFQGTLVKRFNKRSPNQETILSAFQEEGWPRRIDDPLTPKEEIDCKIRLHDSIKRLNQKHVHPLITFKGDGTGQGVLWEKIQPDQ